MPQHARRNSIVVLIALCVPHIIAVLLRGSLNQTPTPGYYVRCGGNAMLWLLACSGSASLACLTASGALFYSVFKRGRGHALNGISLSWATFAAFGGIAFAMPFFNLASAPCWVTPMFYSFVSASCALVAVHTMRRTPDLIRVQDFELSGLIHVRQTVEKLATDEGLQSGEKDDLLKQCLATLQRIEAGREAAQ